ncbi:nickel pincer cofactor biosynthesis protein LarB [bacterium]|nr:nickel pincer cofactor biosynthesis protein LarB [bacterium]
MDTKTLLKLLEDYKNARVSEQEALDILKRLPFEDLGYARVDHHREMRKGFPEVIFGTGKSPEQIHGIVQSLYRDRSNVMITRSSESVFQLLLKDFPEAEFHFNSKAITIRRKREYTGKGKVLVISAGTADIPVAEEAQVTADLFGNRTDCLYDAGVAGLHRLLAEKERLMDARVIIVVAGMEGALPSVVAGLVSAPVIAVPTSVGYGAHFGGVAPLLSMLNSCAALAVVNIDNGFGAGQIASIINHL